MDLPRDLERLSHGQFVALWQQIDLMAAKGHLAPESYRARLEKEALRRRAEADQGLVEANRQIYAAERNLTTLKLGRLS